MALRLWLGALGWAAWAAVPLGAQSNIDLINLREDINGLSQRLSELSLRVEQLEANQSAATRSFKPPADAVTAAQLEAAVSDLNAQLDRLRSALGAAPHSSVTVTTSEETTGGAASPRSRPTYSSATVTTAEETPSASLAPKKGPPAANPFPKQGIMYTVQKGDTVALIAKKTGAKFQDIVKANQLADPSKIYPGQQLAVPGGK